MTKPVLEKIVELLDGNEAKYEVMSHEALGFSSDQVAQVRNVELGQCSKAVILKIKGNGVKKFALAVLPGDQKVDADKLAEFWWAPGVFRQQ